MISEVSVAATVRVIDWFLARSIWNLPAPVRINLNDGSARAFGAEPLGVNPGFLAVLDQDTTVEGLYGKLANEPQVFILNAWMKPVHFWQIIDVD